MLAPEEAERCAANDLLNRVQGDTDTPGDRHFTSSASISGDEGGGSEAAGLLLLLVGVNAECSLVCRARPAAGAVRVDILSDQVSRPRQSAVQNGLCTPKTPTNPNRISR